jgi:hypothetical protein
VVEIDCDHPAAWRIEIGEKVKRARVIAHQFIRCLQLCNQFDKFILILHVAIKEAVTDIGALPDNQGMVTTVIGDLGLKSPFFLIRTFIN